MSAARPWKLISVEEYLAAEQDSRIKHEFLGGVLYAMAGARNVHNLIASNILVGVGSRLRGKPCRTYNSDTKIRIRLATQTRFYYPDASIICRPNSPNDAYQDEPAVIFEVVSKGTRRVDEGEKKDAYLSIPSLQAYVLVEQESAVVVVYRRTEYGFMRELHEGMESILALPEVEVELPLAELYEGVERTPEDNEATDD